MQKDMQKDMVVNVLLIIAGILLAFALFSAGFLVRGKISPKHSKLSHLSTVAHSSMFLA